MLSKELAVFSAIVNSCVPVIFAKEGKSSLFEEYLCYKSGYSELRVNVADALCQPQQSDIFLSASLHFLQKCLEKRLNSLKSESSNCHKSETSSVPSVYSCDKIMACLNGRSSYSLYQDPLIKLPATTQYEDKVKEWSSTFQNSIGRFENYEAFKKSLSDNKINCAINNLRSISGYTNILENVNVDNDKKVSNSGYPAFNNTDFSNYTLQMKNETIFETKNSGISCDDLTKLRQISLTLDDKSPQDNSKSINMTISAVETTKSVNSGINLSSKMSTSIMRLIAGKTKSKSIKKNGEHIALSQNKDKETLTNSSTENSVKKLFQCKQKFSEPIIKKGLSKEKHESRRKNKNVKKLSPTTITRLQRVILRLFKKKNKARKSESTVAFTCDIKCKKKNKNELKMDLKNERNSEERKTVFSQTSQVLICTNSESQTNNSCISLTESGIERLLAENYLSSSHSSGFSREKKIKENKKSTFCFETDPKHSRLTNLKIYRMPNMVACSKCKKSFYNRKYKNVATLTDDYLYQDEYSKTGCPYCTHCSSLTKSKEVSYVSQTVSRTFETKVDIRGDEKMKTSFSWESHNSSRTTLYMEKIASDNAFQSRALSRILEEIMKEHKRKSPHTMAKRSMKMSSRRVNDLNHGITPGMMGSPKLLRQLSKLSVCADNELESTISDYEIKPRSGVSKKTPITKPALNLHPNIYKTETGGCERRESCLQKSGASPDGIRTPTQQPLDVTIHTAASSLATPPDPASDGRISNNPRSGPLEPYLFEKMCKLPLSLLDFLKTPTPTSSYRASNASQTSKPKDVKRKSEPKNEI